MSTFPRWGTTLTTIALLTVAAAADAADPAIASNLTNGSDGYAYYDSVVPGRVVQKFTLGSAWNVTSFEALLGGAGRNNPNVLAKLYNDNAGIVGTDTGVVFAQIGAITSGTTLATFQAVEFDPTTALTLGPGSYWFGIEGTNLNRGFGWAFTNSSVQSGIAGNTIDNNWASNNHDGPYGYGTSSPQIMSVNGVANVAAVPEPGTIATALMFGGGLGALVLKGRRRNA
jgi:hypothetical protein